MFEYISTKLDPEVILWGSFLFGILVIFARIRPAICFAMGFPALIFLGQLKTYFPISTSADAALFPLAVILISLLKGHRFRFGKCEKLMFGLALLIAFSVCYSLNPPYGSDKALLFCFMVVPIVVFAPNIITNVKSLRSVIFIIIWTLIIFVFTSLLFRWRMGSVTGRVAALLDEITAGQFLGLTAVISYLYIILIRHCYAAKVIFFFVLLVSTILLFMTGTRAALLTVIIILMFMYWFIHIDWFKRIFRKPHQTYAIIVLGVLIVLAGRSVLRKVLPEVVYNRYASVENFFNNFSPNEIRNWKISEGRTLNYTYAIKYFFAHPLTGIGAGSYKTMLSYSGKKKYVRAMYRDKSRVYPHNLILEFACEQGILGLIGIICVIYLNAKIIFRLRKMDHLNTQNQFLVCCCVGIYMYGLCVSMASLDVPRMMILWWGMGLLLAVDRIYRQPPKVCLKNQRTSNRKCDFQQGPEECQKSQ